MGRRDLCVLAGFLLFLLIYFSGVLALPGRFCLGRPEGDARNQFYGWRAFGFGEVRAGHFPLWNPYEFLGVPFVAGLQSAMFYPTNWLCAVLPAAQLGRAINLGIILNLFLSGLFTYLWARRCGLKWVGAVVAASAYVFGAPQFLRIFEGHWSFLASMPWIPCLLLCVEIIVSGGFQPLAIAAGAAAVAMQWFGGNPQYAFYGGIAASLYLVGRLWQRREMGARAIARVLGSFGLIYVLGSVLAGVQLIPALELFSVSSRRGQLSYQWVAQDSFVPESFLTFLAPDFFGSDRALRYWGQWNLWEMSAYVGVVVLGLAFIGIVRGERRKVLLASFVALACLALALGANGPALKLLYGRVPGFNLFRGLARFLCPMSLFLALLAGMGADGIVAAATGQSRGSLRREMRVLLAVAILLAAGGIALCSDIRPFNDGWTLYMLSVIVTSLHHHYDLVVNLQSELAAMSQAGFSLLRGAAFLAALAFIIQAARRASSGNASRVAAALLLLVAADAWSFGRRYLNTSVDDTTVQPGVFDPQRDGLSKVAVDCLRQTPEPFRFARGGCFTLPPCEGMTHEFACLEGVQPNVPARFEDVFWALQGQSKAAHRTSYAIFSLRPAFRMFNLRYLVGYSSRPKSDGPGERTVCDDGLIRIDELPGSWPRAWMVHNSAKLHDADAVLRALADPRLNAGVAYENVALLETDPGCPMEPPPWDDRRSVKFPHPYEPNRVELRVNAASAGLLVLSDLYYPGWRATVDGKPAEILCANYVMRAVAVAAGEHNVEFSYEPASFKAGIAASAAGGLAVAVLILLHVRARKEKK